MSAQDQSSIRVLRLKKTFGTNTVIKDLSFEVTPGEFVTLLGPSGCGKTTVLRCIAGLETPDSGEIWIGGRAVVGSAWIPAEKRNVGMVFQSYAIWPHMTVYGNLAYGLRLRKVPATQIKERVMNTLNLLGLGDFAGRYGTELSGGQQQRVAIGRSLVLESDVLLLDEPLSNLDAKLRERLRFELRELQTSLGLTAVYVTHDQTEAMVLSDRVFVMDKGCLVQEGKPEQLYEKPRSLFVANFFGDVNLFRGRILDRQADGAASVAISTLGTVQCCFPERVGGGEEIYLAVRPERITVCPKLPANGVNCWVARLEKQVYLGHHIAIVARVGDVRMYAELPPQNTASLGSEIYLRVEPEAWMLIPSDGVLLNDSRR
jgi:iron(III) transport system ATP-binding protein